MPAIVNVEDAAGVDKLEQIADALGRIGTDVAKKAGGVAAAAGAAVVGVMKVVAKRL